MKRLKCCRCCCLGANEQRRDLRLSTLHPGAGRKRERRQLLTLPRNEAKPMALLASRAAFARDDRKVRCVKTLGGEGKKKSRRAEESEEHRWVVSGENCNITEDRRRMKKLHKWIRTPSKQEYGECSVCPGKAQTDRQTAYISILIMQRLLSDGLVIIAMHSALLFRNHYESRIRSLTSFCLADLLVLTMGGGGREGGEATPARERGRSYVASKTRRREGRRKKERDDVQLKKTKRNEEGIWNKDISNRAESNLSFIARCTSA